MTTPGIDTPRAEHARNLPIAGLICGLAVAIAAKLVFPALPVFNGVSLSRANGVCSGALGAFVSAMSDNAARTCNEVGAVVVAVNLVAVTGLLIACLSLARLVVLARKEGASR